MKTNVGFLHRLYGKIEASAHGKPTFFFCIYVSLKGRPISCHTVTQLKTCDAGIKEKAIGKIAFQNPSYMDRYFASHGNVTIFSAFPTLASGASIARGCPPPNGGAHLAPSLRSRWDRIGQKPEPTFH